LVFFVERVERVLSGNVADPKEEGEEVGEELHDADFGNVPVEGRIMNNEQHDMMVCSKVQHDMKAMSNAAL
jgi:hypothetical protein